MGITSNEPSIEPSNKPEIMPGNGTCQTDVLSTKSLESILKVLSINIQGIECIGRPEQIQILLAKYLIEVAVLTETETSHSYAKTTNIQGFKSFPPPSCVSGPSGKEVGVIMMISNRLSSACKSRNDINGNDTGDTK